MVREAREHVRPECDRDVGINGVVLVAHAIGHLDFKSRLVVWEVDRTRGGMVEVEKRKIAGRVCRETEDSGLNV